MSLATNDLFTDEEYDLYGRMINSMNESERLKALPSEERMPDYEETLQKTKADKQEYLRLLADAIQRHRDTPRQVRLANVLDLKKFRDEQGVLHLPPGVTWWTLRRSNMIAEFESEESRAMGLHANDITFDKIIMTWKSLDMLEQIIHNGFMMPILQEDGTVLYKKYRFHTASAGQIGL